MATAGYATGEATRYATGYAPGSAGATALPDASPGSGYGTPFGLAYATPYDPGTGDNPASPVLFTDQMATYIHSIWNVYAYRDYLPSRQANYPLVSYSVVAGDNFVMLSGPAGMAWVLVQLDVYSADSTQADLLSESLRLVFQRLVGPMGLVRVANCLPSRPRSGYAPSPSGTDRGIYRSSRDFEFQFHQ